MNAETQTSDRVAPPAGDALAGRYLTFRLGEEVYATGIMTVREIIELLEITPVPRSPHFMRGVINLRGRVIPVVDIRSYFGMSPLEVSELTVIIVLQTADQRSFGILVDEVIEVRLVTGEEADPPPTDDRGDAFMMGTARTKGQVIFLLDLSNLATELRNTGRMS